MRDFASFLFAIVVCLSTTLTLPANAAGPRDISLKEDPVRLKKDVHRAADAVRGKAKELSDWQRKTWVAPRSCSGSELRWTTGAKGVLANCTPFRCSDAGVCRYECSSDSDCASGHRCLDRDASGGNGVCVMPSTRSGQANQDALRKAQERR